MHQVRGARKSVNREWEEEVRRLAGLKVYVTNTQGATAEKVIKSTHQNLYRSENACPMAKADLAPTES